MKTPRRRGGPKLTTSNEACGLKGRKAATGTGEESVKTCAMADGTTNKQVNTAFNISPVSTFQKRTDLSIDVVTFQAHTAIIILILSQ